MTQRVTNIIRETYASLLSPICLTIWIVATVVAIVAGPFGTFTALGAFPRFSYWTLISLTSIVLAYMGVALANCTWDDDRALTRDIVGATLAILIVTTNVWAISKASIWGGLHDPGFGELLSYVTLITVAASAVKYLAQTALPELAVKPATVDDKDSPRLMRRIPEADDATILHLSVQDHFVEINTNQGSHEIRMRFRDALDELDGVSGYQVHRSHWVAHEAITGIDREKTRVFLQLSNGNRIPVSRNYRPKLEDAGLL